MAVDRTATNPPNSRDGKRAALFLDKDGTLVEDVPYNVDPDAIRLTDGALDGLRLLHAAHPGTRIRRHHP